MHSEIVSIGLEITSLVNNRIGQEIKRVGGYLPTYPRRYRAPASFVRGTGDTSLPSSKALPRSFAFGIAPASFVRGTGDTSLPSSKALPRSFAFGIAP